MMTIMALTALLTGMSGTNALANPEGTAAQEAQAAKPAPTEFAHILSCAIEGGNQIAIRGQMEGTWSDPAYYDNYLYLFELQPTRTPWRAGRTIADGLRKETRCLLIFP